MCLFIAISMKCNIIIIFNLIISIAVCFMHVFLCVCWGEYSFVIYIIVPLSIYFSSFFIGGWIPVGLTPFDAPITTKRYIYFGNCYWDISSEEYIIRGIMISTICFAFMWILFVHVLNWIYYRGCKSLFFFGVEFLFRGFTSHLGISVHNVKLRVSGK